MDTSNQLTSVLITSTAPDALNSNTVIRDYVAEGFEEAFPDIQVLKSPIETASLMVRDYRPQLVVAVGGLVIDSVDFFPLRRACDKVDAILAFWLHDDPYEFDYAYKAQKLPDIVFTNDLWTMEHYNRENVYHLPLAASRKIHFRPIQIDRWRSITSFFCGVAYPNRVEMFRQAAAVLSSFNTVVMGAHWPPELSFAQNTRLAPEVFADYASNSLITFNIGRDFNLANRRYVIAPSTPGPRTFEIALAGSAQLFFVDSLEIENYFEPDAEILLFDSVKDIQEILQRAFEEPEWVIEIAKKSQERALREHCYRHRAEKIEAVYSELTTEHLVC